MKSGGCGWTIEKRTGQDAVFSRITRSSCITVTCYFLTYVKEVRLFTDLSIKGLELLVMKTKLSRKVV